MLAPSKGEMKLFCTSGYRKLPTPCQALAVNLRVHWIVNQYLPPAHTIFSSLHGMPATNKMMVTCNSFLQPW